MPYFADASSPLQLRSRPRSASCTGGCHPRHFWAPCSTQTRPCPFLETTRQACSHSQQKHPLSSLPATTLSRRFAWRDESAYNAPQPPHTGVGGKARIQRLRRPSWYARRRSPRGELPPSIPRPSVLKTADVGHFFSPSLTRPCSYATARGTWDVALRNRWERPA